MDFIFLIVFAILSFVLLTLFRRWHDFFVLMAVSIGYGVNSAVYNSFNDPVLLGGNICIGIESILYFVFSYILVITLRDYGLDSFKNMALSTIVAIVISGTIEFFFNLSTANEITMSIFERYSFFIFSAVGSLFGVWLMAFIYNALVKRHLNIYLIFIICIVVLNACNYLFVYSLTYFIFNSEYPNFLYHLLGDVIVKAFCLILGCASYYINHNLWHKIDSKK